MVRNIPKQTKKVEEYEENSSFKIPISFSIQILNMWCLWVFCIQTSYDDDWYYPMEESLFKIVKIIDHGNDHPNMDFGL